MLLAKNKDDLDTRQGKREIPCCLPELEAEKQPEDSDPKTIDRFSFMSNEGSPRTPHHADNLTMSPPPPGASHAVTIGWVRAACT